MLRYGIIGSGMMGQEHIRNIRLLDGAEVAAISDPDEGMRQRAGAIAGSAESFADWRDMVSADVVDAYLIAAPNDTHHGILLDLLPGNKPVLVEKPLCTTAAHCREAISASLGRTAPTWVAMEYRYMPPLQRLMQELDSGSAGDLKMMSIREHRFPFLDKVADWNRFSERTGGTLVEKCCHFWDLMRLVLKEEPVRVFASAARDVNHADEVYDGRTPDIIDNAMVVVEFSGGKRAHLDLCMFAEGAIWQETVSVIGDKARVEAHIPSDAATKGRDAPDAYVTVADRVSGQRRIDVPVDETILNAGSHHGSTYYQHQRFSKLVRSGTGIPEVTLEDGLWSVRVGEAAEMSAREHRVVEVSEI